MVGRAFAGLCLLLTGACSSPASTAKSVPVSPAMASASPASASPAAPKPIEPTHGGKAWGVYLAVGQADDPSMKDAVARLKARGIDSGAADLSCDQGALQGFTSQTAVSGSALTVAVYFATEADARAFAATLSPPPLGVSHVTTYCLD